jgi:molecular chaperone GrpE
MMSEDKVDTPVPEPAEPSGLITDSLTEPAPAVEEAPAPPSAQELADLRAKAAQAQQFQDQWLRAAADLDNFRKRAARERAEAVRYAQEGLLQKLVPVLDNFEMAMLAASGPNTSAASLQAGVAMIQQQLKSALVEAGLEEIDALGKPFDPNLHEAMAQESSTEMAEGHVLRQTRKGYRLRERLLRPASVVVAKAPGAAPAAAGPAAG